MDKQLKEQLLDVLMDMVPYVKGILVYGSLIKGYVDMWKGSILRSPFHLTNKGSILRSVF